LIPLPWFIFSFLNTGNPLYPFFSETYIVSLNLQLFNIFNFIKEIGILFTNLSDPISPIYVAFLPLAIFLYRRFPRALKTISWYSIMAIAVWYFTPRTGGGRFILPYLPGLSVLAASSINYFENKKFLRNVLLISVIFVFAITIFYRMVANYKYLNIIFGSQTKNEFLTLHLNFDFGDFYDIDNYFKKNIKATDKVLLYGFHNLYYVDFPFIDSSFIKSGDKFNYVATQKSDVPERFNSWHLIYKNSLTHVKLYSKVNNLWEEY